MAEDERTLDATVSDDCVREMVEAVKPAWTVDTVDRNPHGTDFVATVTVQTPTDTRRVVIKAATAGLREPAIAAAEPLVLQRLATATDIPVPTVYGAVQTHETLPAPFFVMSFVEGATFECATAPPDLSPAAREQVVADAGRYLAVLHELGPLSAVGHLGVDGGNGNGNSDDELVVLDTDANPRYDAFRPWLADYCERTLDSLTSGGWFPELADDPRRFADLVPDIRSYVERTIPSLPEPDPPTYCNRDYRYENLVVVPATGETRAVLDWEPVLSVDPMFNLATTEFQLLSPDSDRADRTETLRATLREAYRAQIHRERDGNQKRKRNRWTFDESVRERIRFYRLVCHLDAMACFPLWYGSESATDEQKERTGDSGNNGDGDEKQDRNKNLTAHERRHRAAIEEYLA